MPLPSRTLHSMLRAVVGDVQGGLVQAERLKLGVVRFKNPPVSVRGQPALHAAPCTRLPCIPDSPALGQALCLRPPTSGSPRRGASPRLCRCCLIFRKVGLDKLQIWAQLHRDKPCQSGGEGGLMVIYVCPGGRPRKRRGFNPQYCTCPGAMVSPVARARSRSPRLWAAGGHGACKPAPPCTPPTPLPSLLWDWNPGRWATVHGPSHLALPTERRTAVQCSWRC